MKQQVEESIKRYALNPRQSRKFSAFIGILIIIGSFLVYLPVVHRFFVSDDFEVLYRVCRENTIFIKGFFRPLSDITIFLNYQSGGLNPTIFNSFNILIHGINTYIIYLICLYSSRSFGQEYNTQFAIISSAIFLTYPFHNEAVVWLLGRGASIACLFSLLSILSFYRIKNRSLNIIAVCCFYFISIAAFESTIFLPVIFILLLVLEKENIRYSIFYMCGLMSMFVFHLLIRHLISGSIMGSYGKDFFHPQLKIYLLNMAKVGGRLILPPTQNAFLITGVFVLLILVSAFYLFRNYKKTTHSLLSRYFLIIIGMLIISCIVPVVTGVSTQTSETDRILYLPSVFVSILEGLFVVYILKKNRLKIGFLIFLFSYNLFFLEKNNLNWIKASFVTRSVMSAIQSAVLNDKAKKIFFVNIPTEIQGAYSFRHGFPEALKLYDCDSGRFIIINYLSRREQEEIKASKMYENSGINLPPEVVIKSDSGSRRVYYDGVFKYLIRPTDEMYYWNGNLLKNL